MNDIAPAVVSSQSVEGRQTETMCLSNATLVLHEKLLTGYLTIENGLVSEIGEGTRVPPGAIDCQGDYLIPGLVELHTDNLERHMEPRPDVDWPHLAALVAHDGELASTGITTVFDALRVGSMSNTKTNYDPYARSLADVLLQARSEDVFKISHFLHLRAEICSETLLEEMTLFGADDRVGIVSLMDHTPGQRQFRDLTALRVYLTKKRNLDDQEFVDHVNRLKTLQQLNGIKHEAGAVTEARRYGAVLASHDDTTPEQVETSKANGVQFAEFPTTRIAAQACRENGIAVMMGAPNIIRGASHSGNVSACELAEANLLDIVSSDYVPSALLLSAFRLAEIWQDLPRAIACVTSNPAKAAGLNDRGKLETGYRGDVVRVALNNSTPLLRGSWSHGCRVA